MCDSIDPDEIEVTPEMICAGVRALSLFEIGDDLDWVVSHVYEQMTRQQNVHLRRSALAIVTPESGSSKETSLQT